LEQNLRVQVGELQNQLTERLALLETRNKEVQALNSKVTELADRLDRSEVDLEQVRATAASEIEQIRQQSQLELTARHEEIERKAEDLQDREAALYAAEHSFKDEIDALRTEVAEKRFLLENRTDQLVRVKVEMDELQKRIADLESERQAEKEAREKAEQEGKQTRIELDKLWDELGPKGQLEERQVAVNDLNQNFQEPIGNLPIELSEKQVLIENPNRGFLLGDPNLTETQKEKLNQLEQLLETIKADNEKRLISPQNRKWRFSLTRKRRWKS
jgi:chromosome segregation ATPase